MAQPLLIVHVIHRLAMGGLENGLINLLNHGLASHYRHAIVCMTDYSDFRDRIQDTSVEVFAINRKEGRDWGAQRRLFELIRRLKPAIVHSRGMSGLNSLLPAVLNGVPARIHGEHGRDMGDLDGSNRKGQWIRRLHRPLVNRYIALSKDLESYLATKIGVPHERIAQIYNGVNCRVFHPATAGREELPEPNFSTRETIVIGTVGRMQEVKDQVNLTRAFIHLVSLLPEHKSNLRLAMIGDGPTRAACENLLSGAGLRHLAWIPGPRDDVAALMRGMDIFVLPSLAEGISNTILEAMATGLPIVATAVGGNPELVEEGVTGRLVPEADPVALAEAIKPYVVDSQLRRRHGQAGRHRAETRFSMDAMMNSYMQVYAHVLERKVRQTAMQS
jgi:sugar transferase (PEP-CTERM/EpsH1 system associated)